MKKTLIIFSMLTLAAYASLGSGASTEHGVAQVNSTLYKVTAAGEKAVPMDMDVLLNNARSKAKAFCAKSKRLPEIDTITRLEADMGRPASVTLLFWCNKSN
jgi:hypothetical protein